MYPMLAELMAQAADSYALWPSSAAVFLPGGRPPRTGEIFVQADLARTLRYMADEEAAHAGKGREAGLKAAIMTTSQALSLLTERYGVVIADD